MRRMKKKPFTKKEKQKNIVAYFIAILLVFVLAGFLLLSTTDIYINRGLLAKKDFSRAFEARITGNCDKFSDYLLKDFDNWSNKCLREKKLQTDPFYSFKVLGVTVSGDKAFIQAELVRGIQKMTYPVTYEMKLDDGKWKINQNAN